MSLNLGIGYEDLTRISAAGAQLNYDQGLNPFMVQVGQAHGQALVDQAQFQSAQISAMTRQQNEQEKITKLQRRRSLIDMIHDEAARESAYASLDKAIMDQLAKLK